MRLLRVLMMVVAAIACTGVPARADDISAAARGVVRVVIIAQADGEELGRGHGSGRNRPLDGRELRTTDGGRVHGPAELPGDDL